ncbi:unnamed protein product [Alternaria alternata]
MFLLRRNLDKCIAVFKQLAQRVFRPRQPFGSSPLAKVAAEIEACVKEAFRSDATLFSFTESGTRMSGAKVAVTTITVSSARLCILSNYNRASVRQVGYKHHQASHIEEEPLICNAARATSAAPSYFPAKFIQGLGFLQDSSAGKHNNPINPAE